MSTNFTIELRQGYVHVQLEPEYEVTRESMAHLSSALIAFCKEHNCRQVLSEGVRPKRQMSMLDVYQTGVTVSKGLVGVHVACYWEGYQTDEMTDLFKSVTHNRGVVFQFFPNRVEALQWLGIESAD
jgi:hypothetical protein